MPKPNYASFLTRVSKARGPSAIRALMPLLGPGVISLGGGLPNPETFPISGLSVKLKNGESIDLSADDINGALQYSATEGMKPLVTWMRTFQREMHFKGKPEYNPFSEDYRLLVTTGGQDGLTKSFEMLLSEGDSILVEEMTYPGALAALLPLNVNIVGTAMDERGIVPEKLEALLNGWGNTRSEMRKPRVLYTVPTGQNPCGATITPERRKEVYRICCEHDVIILEDDPYYYMQFTGVETSSSDWVASLVPSYFSMDTDCRVIRFDSFSKVLSSGLRLGFVTGPKPFVDRIDFHMQSSSLHTSGLSQTVASAMLIKMGTDGYRNHLFDVMKFYRKRRDTFTSLAKKHLTGLARWTIPAAGMFVWFTVDSTDDTYGMIMDHALKEGVLLIPGQVCTTSGKEKTNTLRAAYSTASEEQMDEALRRLSNLLKSSEE